MKQQGLNWKTDSGTREERGGFSVGVCRGTAVCVPVMRPGDGANLGQFKRFPKKCPRSPGCFSTCCDSVLQSLLLVFAFLPSLPLSFFTWLVCQEQWLDETESVRAHLEEKDCFVLLKVLDEILTSLYF